MANYSLTINSKFQPFSFERYMQPIQIYANLYEKQEAALDALDEKASQWEMLADMAGNEKAYSKYKNYADKLRAEADELATVGLTPNSRARLRQLTSQYRTDVRPIEQAYSRWQELEKEQRAYKASQNFNVAFDNDYSTMRLDDLIANPKQSYTAISGEDVTNRTAALAKQALQSVVDNPELTPTQRGLIITKMKSGATMEELQRAMELGLEPGQTGDEAVDALLQVARTINDSYSGNAAYNQDFIWRNIKPGLYGGVGTTTYNVTSDPSYLDPAEQYQLDTLKQANTPVQMENGVWYDKVHGMYYKINENGKRTYYSYDPNLYGNSEVMLDPTQAANYNVGDKIPSTDGTAPSIVVKKDPKTGYASVSKLTPVAGYDDVFTDGSGHFYNSKAEMVQNPFSGNNDRGGLNAEGNYERYLKPENIKNVNNYPIYWRAWKDEGDRFEDMGNQDNTFWNYGPVGNRGYTGPVTDINKINRILNNSSALSQVKRYIAQVTGISVSEITDEKAKDAVRQGKININKDEDWISKNHYFVAVPSIPRSDELKSIRKKGKFSDEQYASLRDDYNDLYNFIKPQGSISTERPEDKEHPE